MRSYAVCKAAPKASTTLVLTGRFQTLSRGYNDQVLLISSCLVDTRAEFWVIAMARARTPALSFHSFFFFKNKVLVLFIQIPRSDLEL